MALRGLDFSLCIVLLFLMMFIITDKDLVGFWLLTEKQRGSDLSGNKNDIKFHNVLYERACGSCEKVVSLQGVTTSYGVILGDSALDVQKSFTWMATVYLTSLQDGPLFEWTDDTSPHGYGGRIWRWQGNFHFGPNGFLPPVDIAALDHRMLNRWIKLALSWDFDTGLVKTYFDGLIISTQVIRGDNKFIHTTNENVYIGVR